MPRPLSYLGDNGCRCMLVLLPPHQPRHLSWKLALTPKALDSTHQVSKKRLMESVTVWPAGCGLAPSLALCEGPHRACNRPLSPGFWTRLSASGEAAPGCSRSSVGPRGTQAATPSRTSVRAAAHLPHLPASCWARVQRCRGGHPVEPHLSQPHPLAPLPPPRPAPRCPRSPALPSHPRGPAFLPPRGLGLEAAPRPADPDTGFPTRLRPPQPRTRGHRVSEMHAHTRLRTGSAHTLDKPR